MKDALILKMLDVSTGHMTKEDNDKLGSGTKSCYELSEYGWLAYVGEIEDNWYEMSPAFNQVMKKAKELDCDYVRFDRDGREYDELLFFEW